MMNIFFIINNFEQHSSKAVPISFNCYKNNFMVLFGVDVLLKKRLDGKPSVLL